MKFVTFKTQEAKETRFGFKSSERIIDIGLVAKWLHEKIMMIGLLIFQRPCIKLLKIGMKILIY